VIGTPPRSGTCSTGLIGQLCYCLQERQIFDEAKAFQATFGMAA
jgi:hypothetical protein